ncbi:MAG TPA: DUF4325 domain-containing protein [Saprospiraceae bacterium]|nr:DUF4325 domain-containing protein [Saprospiraceae bacterium]
MDIVGSTITNAGGYQLYVVLSESIKNQEVVDLSMEKATPLSSSFLNSSFGQLIEDFGYSAVKKYVGLSCVKKSDAERIKNYITSLLLILDKER